MKKLLLSSAIAATMGVAGYAQAVDLDDSSTAIYFANEVTVPADNSLDVDPTAADGGLVIPIGFSISAGTAKYVRLTFSEALGADLDEAADFALSSGGANFGLSQGGLEGDDYVIVEVEPTGAAASQSDTFTFQPQDGDEITVTSKANYNVEYALFDSPIDAVNETNALASVSGLWFGWKSGLDTSCANLSSEQVDITDTTQFIGGASSVDILSVTADVDATVFKADGTAVALTDYLDGITATVEGDFTGFESDAAPSLGADALTLDTTDFLSGEVTIASGTALNAAALTVDNADASEEIIAGNYSVTLEDAGAATYDVGVLELGTCGNLQYSGSTDRLDFALTPDGVFSQMVRITNPSGTAGGVNVTLYNDEGDRVSFALDAVEGVDSAQLGAYSSSKLININDLYAAAQAADSSFEIGTDGLNKLRVEVRGEFGDDVYETATNTGQRTVTRGADGIYIQAVTVSRDNNAFYQVK